MGNFLQLDPFCNEFKSLDLTCTYRFCHLIILNVVTGMTPLQGEPPLCMNSTKYRNTRWHVWNVFRESPLCNVCTVHSNANYKVVYMYETFSGSHRFTNGNCETVIIRLVNTHPENVRTWISHEIKLNLILTTFPIIVFVTSQDKSTAFQTQVGSEPRQA